MTATVVGTTVQKKQPGHDADIVSVPDAMFQLMDQLIRVQMHSAPGGPSLFIITPGEVVGVTCDEVCEGWLDVAVNEAYRLAEVKAVLCFGYVPLRHSTAQDLYVVGASGEVATAGLMPMLHAAMAIGMDHTTPEITSTARFLWGQAWEGHGYMPGPPESLQEGSD